MIRSRLSRLLRIAPSQELHPTDFTELQEALTPEEAAAAQADIAVGHDPELTARDEAIFLLHTAAEIEHALMIQYLFAAYSLKAANNPEDIPEDKGRLTPDQQTLVNRWHREIIKIAAEEMGHLASVQNLLYFIGGSLNFEREDFPFRNGLYPFRFKLEPLTKNSLAKYVYAEMPEGLTGDDIDKIKHRAMGNMDDSLTHVGLIFKALTNLFGKLTEFAEDSEFLQADDIWKQGHSNLIIETVKNRDDALTLIDKIARQGEGLEDMTLSHYRRFREIYDAFPEEDEWKPTFNLAANPNTTPEDAVIDSEADSFLQKVLKDGSITDPKTRLWAQLLNARYRMLLIDISHALHLRTDDKVESKRREILRRWAFVEMRANIAGISRFLTLLPLKQGDAEKLCAGPPFELPYTLNLPVSETTRWRLHQDMIRSSQMLTAKILEEAAPDEEQKKYLEELAVRDAKDLEKAQNPDADGGGSGEPNMNRFSEVIKILDDAVENSPIGFHGNFWRNKTRDEFVALSVFGQLLFAKKADGTFDENESNLIKALEGRAPFGNDIGTPGALFPRMPVGFSVVPQDKIDFIRNWIKDGCPDDGETPPQTAGLSFEADIKSLFRDIPDRSAMLAFGIDLHKFENVRDRAEDILERVENHSMPCDDAKWNDEQIAKFRKWIDDGKNP